MALKKWQGQRTDLSMSGGSLPTDPFGVLQNTTAAPTRNVEELRGAGDTEWVDLMETDTAFEISGEAMSWDPETWDRAIGWDEATSEVDNSADVATFTATVTFESSDGSTKVIEFGECYFDPPPEIGGARDEWAGMTIELRAKTINSITNPA